MRRRQAGVIVVTARQLIGAVDAAGLDDWRQWDDLDGLREFLARFGCTPLDYIRARYAVRRGRGHEWAPGLSLPPAHPRRYRKPWR